MQRRPEVAASSQLQEGTSQVTHKEPATGNQDVVVGSSIASASVKPQPDEHKLPGRQPKQPAVSASQSAAQHAQQAKQTDQQHPKPRAAFSRATKQMPSADKPPTGQLQRTPRQAQHAQHTPRQTQHAQRAPRQAAAGKASAKVALPAELLQNSKVMQAAGTTQPLQPSTDVPPTSDLVENHQAVHAARHAQHAQRDTVTQIAKAGAAAPSMPEQHVGRSEAQEAAEGPDGEAGNSQSVGGLQASRRQVNQTDNHAEEGTHVKCCPDTGELTARRQVFADSLGTISFRVVSNKYNLESCTAIPSNRCCIAALICIQVNLISCYCHVMSCHIMSC